MDCSLPGFSVYRVFQARTLEWVAISFSRGSSWPRDQTWVSCITGRFFTVWATGKPKLAEGLFICCCYLQLRNMLISNSALWPPSHIQSSDQRAGSSMPPAWYRQALEASTLYTLEALSALFLLEGGSDISPSASRALQMQRFSVWLRYNPQLLVPLTESSLTSFFQAPNLA